MKIVQANKFLYPNGGADRYCCSLIEELPKLGVEIVPFGMADSKNLDTRWKKYFTENLNYHKVGLNFFKIGRRLIWSREAFKKFAQLLDESKADLVHAHNIYHQLSPSILVAAKDKKIPVIMTLHDYKLICPNYLLFTHGKSCERCVTGSTWNCLKYDCYYSYPRSFLAALESFIHNKVWHIYQNNINLFIAPSEYLKQMMVKGGWPADKIIVLVNPAPAYLPQPDGAKLLYFGRLSTEKGVDVLIRALKLTDEKLDIVGRGDDEDKLKALVKELSLENRVTFHGYLGGELLEKFKREAKAVILPSLWAENMSLALLESLAYGKLIIASASGGTPELIEDQKTGFLFKPGDVEGLAKKINDLKKLSASDRTTIASAIKEKIVPLELKQHLAKLINIYKQYAK